MKLTDLLQRVKVQNAFTDIDIAGVQFDSRKVASGDLFVALRGTASDGHDFIPMAIAQGAEAIVCEVVPVGLQAEFIKVEDTAETLAQIAAALYGFPSEQLRLVGVTGTNGKTTVATLLYEMFRKFSHRTGLLSTVCNYIDGEPVAATHTTPDPLELNRLLRRMVDAGCEYAFMEVSSHAIVQKRIAALDFDGGIFTNLTQDHLDYHRTMAEYLKAKKTFFDSLPRKAFALTNTDDKNGMVMLQNTQAEKKTYSTRTLADFKGKMLEKSFEGMLLQINEREVSVPFIGKFNVYNLLAVFGAAVLLGKPTDETLRLMSTLHPVNGRFETLRAPQGYIAVVDYAHTPDALKNVLATISDITDGRGKIITVVGCGGNRDRGKRPLMAREALAASTQVIITSDNPRNEDPQAIIDDMLRGLDTEQMRRVLCIVDRRQAIRTACTMANAGDIVLVAGKGHEDYQIIGNEKTHFDDKEEVKSCF